MPTLRNNGRLYRAPRGSSANWPRGAERDVTDEQAAQLLTTGRFSVVAPPLACAPVVVVPVKKAAPKARSARKRKPRK